MAQALPSFVELLASLDLESDGNPEAQNYAHYPTSPSFVTSSPSSSLPSSLPSSQTSSSRFLTSPGRSSSFPTPSPSIVISHPSPVDDPIYSRRRSISNRYSPYVPPDVFSRRRSLPGDLTDHPDNVQKRSEPCRASSASPPMIRASLREPLHESLSRLSRPRITMSETDQPISSLVRRRHPQSSPQSPDILTTSRRSASPTDPLTPVSLPSLPPLPRISTSTNSPTPESSPDLPHLPRISALDRRSPTFERTDPPSRTGSRTPQPSSRSGYDVSSLVQAQRHVTTPPRGHMRYGRLSPS